MTRNNIKEILATKDISINQLAKALEREYSGVHRLVNRASLDTTPLATLLEISDYLNVDVRKLYEEDVKMLRLKVLEEGQEEVLKEGTLKEIIEHLENNTDLYGWVQGEDPDMELPNLEDVEVIRDLQAELSKVDLGWWALEVEEI